MKKDTQINFRGEKKDKELLDVIVKIKGMSQSEWLRKQIRKEALKYNLITQEDLI